MAHKQERQSSMCSRDCGVKERESKGREVVLVMLLKLPVKDKLLYSKRYPCECERMAAETPEEKQDYNRQAPIDTKG